MHANSLLRLVVESYSGFIVEERERNETSIKNDVLTISKKEMVFVSFQLKDRNICFFEIIKLFLFCWRYHFYRMDQGRVKNIAFVFVGLYLETH